MGTGVGAGMQAVGAGVGAVGAYNQSLGNRYAYDYQSQIARNNAGVAEWQAQDALTRGEATAANHLLKTANLRSTQTAGLAARGIDIGEGSPLNILADTTFMGERDAGTIRDNAAKEAWGLRVQAANFRSNAEFLSARARAERPWLAAGTTLLTGGSSASSSWYRGGGGGGGGGSGGDAGAAWM